MNHTQIQFVKNRLKDTGRISRNFCLSLRISRLGAIIDNLKKQGFEFTAYYQPNEHGGRDYIYEQLNRPPKPKVRHNENGTVSLNY